MTGVPVSKTILEFLAVKSISYNLVDKLTGNCSFSPRLFSRIGFSLFNLLTILLIKLCASSIITTESSKIFLV